MKLSTLRGAVGAGCALSLLATSPALGLDVTIDTPSPVNGAQIQTTASGVTIPIDWTEDHAGCHPDRPVNFSINTENLTDPGVLAIGFAEAVVPKDGPATMVRPAAIAKDTDVRWTIRLSCFDAANPDLPLAASAARSFQLLAPDLRPRAVGPYIVTNSGYSASRGKRKEVSGADIYTFNPLCEAGPCKTRMNFRGVGNVLMNYTAARKRWSGSLSGTKVNELVTCRREGGSGAAVKNAYRGRVTFALTHRSGQAGLVGTQTRSLEMTGAARGTLRPTEAGRRAKCAKVELRVNLRAIAGVVVQPEDPDAEPPAAAVASVRSYGGR